MTVLVGPMIGLDVWPTGMRLQVAIPAEHMCHDMRIVLPIPSGLVLLSMAAGVGDMGPAIHPRLSPVARRPGVNCIWGLVERARSTGEEIDMGCALRPRGTAMQDDLRRPVTLEGFEAAPPSAHEATCA
jgi:hypothetical protein